MPNNVFLYYKEKVERQYYEKNDESIKMLLYVSSTLKYSCVNIIKHEYQKTQNFMGI